jgi:hypothetical protein
MLFVNSYWLLERTRDLFFIVFLLLSLVTFSISKPYLCRFDRIVSSNPINK